VPAFFASSSWLLSSPSRLESALDFSSVSPAEESSFLDRLALAREPIDQPEVVRPLDLRLDLAVVLVDAVHGAGRGRAAASRSNSAGSVV
jgi:hypothetical protein